MSAQLSAPVTYEILRMDWTVTVINGGRLTVDGTRVAIASEAYPDVMLAQAAHGTWRSVDVWADGERVARVEPG